MDLRVKRVMAILAIAVGVAAMIGLFSGAIARKPPPAPPSPELAAMLGAAATGDDSSPPGQTGTAALSPTPPGPAVLPAAAGGMRVHVAGAAKRTGVYTLAPGARVQDALNAAGGPAAKADLNAINLADFVKDGERVDIPFRGRPASAPTLSPPAPGPSAGRYPGAAPRTAAATPAVAAVTAPDGVPGAGGRVNINTADAAQLDTLPGVGPATAAAILAHRQQHGPFLRVEDIQDVRGIGPRKFAAMKDRITVR